MSGQRFAFYGLFEPREAGRPSHRPLEQGPVDVKRHRRQVITVPAGKTRLAILDDKPLAATTDARFLGLNSTVEGVEWWPIDSATPSVDEDTSPFGMQIDYDANSYDHVHGQPSYSGATNHHSIGSAQTNDGNFPSFLSNAQDRTYLTIPGAVQGNSKVYFHDRVTATSTPRSSAVLSGGYAEDLTVTSPLLLDDRTMIRYLVYALGKSGYVNFGTQDDSLRLHAYIYVKDHLTTISTHSTDPVLDIRLLNYPYTATLTDPTLVPSVNYDGVEVWGKTEPMLCPYNTTNPTPSGFLFFTASNGSEFRWLPTSSDLTLLDGYQILALPKKTLIGSGSEKWRKITSNLPAFNIGDDPTWSRITMFVLGINAASTTAQGSRTTDCRFVNFYFGPAPGSRHRIRPFELTEDEPWAIASIPAIGIQNPTSSSADVEVVYGGI